MGVAPEASLHLHSYCGAGCLKFTPTWWADGTTDAKNDGAIVQNNSWGYSDDRKNGSTDTSDISDAVTYQSNNSTTAAQTLVAFQSIDTDGDGTNDVMTSASESDWNSYINALNSFQQTGVIVFALSNQDYHTDADIAAGLPEIATNLQEAWINVANIDVTGTGTPANNSYELRSAPCGSTAEYCLGADGWNILGAGGFEYTSGGYDYSVSIGTSYAAPQVSGAIALLATHFPNHTPEQLVDRLLATAYNDWAAFGVDGTTTFGNGVVHGYSTDYGHGVMDIYQALQPITSNMLGRSIYTSNQNLNNSVLLNYNLQVEVLKDQY